MSSTALDASRRRPCALLEGVLLCRSCRRPFLAYRGDPGRYLHPPAASERCPVRVLPMAELERAVVERLCALVADWPERFVPGDKLHCEQHIAQFARSEHRARLSTLFSSLLRDERSEEQETRRRLLHRTLLGVEIGRSKRGELTLALIGPRGRLREGPSQRDPLSPARGLLEALLADERERA